MDTAHRALGHCWQVFRYAIATSRCKRNPASDLRGSGGALTPVKGGRGGYGLFSALNQGSTYYAMRVENGIVQVNYNYTGCSASSTSPTTCASIPANALAYPNVPFQPTGPSISGALYPTGGAVPSVGGPAKLGTQSFHGLDPNFVPPLAHEAEFGIEQALPGKMSLSVGYVGTRALRLPVFVDANLIGQTPHGMRTYNILDANNNLIRQMTVPVYLVSDRRDSRLQSYDTGFSVANTWYNSMAVSLRRPFANGLELLANYTWSRATDTDQVQGAGGTFYGGNTVLDPNNIRGENGLSDIGLQALDDNLDFRISRDIPVTERIRLQLTAEAFNLLNHMIITGVNSTYSAYTSATSTSATCNSKSSAPVGSVVQGCIAPYSATGISAFGAASATSIRSMVQGSCSLQGSCFSDNSLH